MAPKNFKILKFLVWDDATCIHLTACSDFDMNINDSHQWRSHGGSGGSRTPIMLEKILDQKKIHAIVLRLYTYKILFATSRLS
jgi:hypothetical protein